ncbi:NTP transferase domain-containing protein [Actinomadura kijaniata]|uniref:Molybdopterin-guanine dinucleotide biosynthesis protein A n=1 Tax=Actinomadura namibiensis TaxID=182080 RepID=A0A7W3LW12_ACTNM|nr:NTP transferase domain-containing protein [Actinomadura namibiensis]MBA8955338.1 molybdopterin-guanine dinucleotide biosynthesis protein A [Actinomadura namibiensis]
MTPDPTGPPGPFDAVILAGGQARRLGGADKPAAAVGGRPLLAWVAGAAAGARRLVVVGPPRDAVPDAVTVREDPPGAGPVPALRAGLAEVDAPWVVLLAADLPFLRARHVTALREAARDAAGAVLLDDRGREQWLAGCWRTAALRAALRGYTRSSLHGLLRPLEPVPVTAEAGERPPWYDCDTPDTLARADLLAAADPCDSGGPSRGRNGMLEDWIKAVCLELGVARDDLDRDLVLDLARDVAHQVTRPGAPVTAYLLGLAVGKGIPARDAAARLTEMAECWKDRPGATGQAGAEQAVTEQAVID